MKKEKEIIRNCINTYWNWVFAYLYVWSYKTFHIKFLAKQLADFFIAIQRSCAYSSVLVSIGVTLSKIQCNTIAIVILGVLVSFPLFKIIDIGPDDVVRDNYSQERIPYLQLTCVTWFIAIAPICAFATYFFSGVVILYRIL